MAIDAALDFDNRFKHQSGANMLRTLLTIRDEEASRELLGERPVKAIEVNPGQTFRRLRERNFALGETIESAVTVCVADGLPFAKLPCEHAANVMIDAVANAIDVLRDAR